LLAVMKNPRFLTNKSVRLKNNLLNFPLGFDSDFVLCGKVDWLEFMEGEQAIHIVDFKTSKSQEKEDSLQLGIYFWLVSHFLQSKQVDNQIKKMSYWYLDLNLVEERKLPNIQSLEKEILKIGQKMKLAIKLKSFSCPKNGCFCCRDWEKIIANKAQLVGLDGNGKELYFVKRQRNINFDGIKTDDFLDII